MRLKLTYIEAPKMQTIIEVDAFELTQLLNRADNADLRKLLINWSGQPHVLDLAPEQTYSTDVFSPFNDDQRSRWLSITKNLADCIQAHRGVQWSQRLGPHFGRNILTKSRRANPMEYQPIMASLLVDHCVRYADTPIFYKEGDVYREVTYLNWHTEGTTWIGGTLDVGFADKDRDDIQIDPYSYLYIPKESIDAQTPTTDQTDARSESVDHVPGGLDPQAADRATVGSRRTDVARLGEGSGDCPERTAGKEVSSENSMIMQMMMNKPIPPIGEPETPKYPAWQRAIRAAQAITEEKIEEAERQHRIEQEAKNREYGLNLAKALAFFGIMLPEPPIWNSVYIDGFHFWLSTIGSYDKAPYYSEYTHTDTNKLIVRFDLVVSADRRSGEFTDYTFNSTETIKVNNTLGGDFTEVRSELAYKMDLVQEAYQHAHKAYLKKKANDALLEAAKTFPPNVSAETQQTISYLQELIDLLEFSPEKLTPGDKLVLAAVEALSWAKQPVRVETFAADL